MSYRGDQEALQQRVEALESELATAKEKIAELSGAEPTIAAGSGETLGARSSIGAPTSVRIEKVIAGELSSRGFEAVAALLRERLKLEAAQVGARMETLARRAPGARVEVAVRDGKTHLLLEQSFAGRATGAWIFAGLFALMAGVIAGAFGHDLFHLSDAMSFVQALWAAPLVGTLAALLLRPHVRKNVETELANDRGAFAAIAQVVEEDCARGARVRVQSVETDDAEELALDHEEVAARAR